ncbi:thiamine-binding protein [Corynebacterium sp. Marseille-P8863]|uniref:thiamine-binding protein n=1 Tax=Corynebacterium sp. Marseille-P8863 TaxID=2866576 RepID=UPI00226507A7|nr:thiamine-binding protein [Corynebacterium sp. Marseille-P8863]
MIAAFSVAPTVTNNATAEMSEAVSRAVRVVRESGLPHETTAMFTTIEGEWDEVMDVIKRATQAVEAVSPRVSLVIKADIRPGYTDMMHQKVASLEKHFSNDANDANDEGAN